jgi:hypothetical protein
MKVFQSCTFRSNQLIQASVSNDVLSLGSARGVGHSLRAHLVQEL